MAEVKKGWNGPVFLECIHCVLYSLVKESVTFFFCTGGLNLPSDIFFGCPENIILKC